MQLSISSDCGRPCVTTASTAGVRQYTAGDLERRSAQCVCRAACAIYQTSLGVRVRAPRRVDRWLRYQTSSGIRVRAPKRVDTFVSVFQTRTFTNAQLISVFKRVLCTFVCSILAPPRTSALQAGMGIRSVGLEYSGTGDLTSRTRWAS